MLDPRRLRLLVLLQSLGTVRAVASCASLSPSAVSQALATLEAESGVALLSRHGRSVHLTPAGVALAAHAVEILDRIDLAEDELHGWRDGTAGLVRIGAFSSALSAFVIAAVASLAEARPDLRVQLRELEPEHTLPALERGEIDLAVVADMEDGTVPRSAAVEVTPLASDELHAVLPAGRGPDGPSIALDALRDARWIVDGTDLERAVVALCRRSGFEPQIESRLFSHGAILRAVEAGLGVTVLPTYALEPGFGVRAVPLRPAAPRELRLLTRAGAAGRRHSVALAREAIVDVGGRRAETSSARAAPRSP